MYSCRFGGAVQHPAERCKSQGLLMMHGSPGGKSFEKKNVIFQLVPFFPSFFRRPYFFVYIYIYYVWIQIDRLRLMYKIYINIMSGDNKLWAWRKYHDPTKKGEASDSVRLLSFGHLKNPILQLMDFSPPNSFPETWNQSQQKHRFGKNLFICDCEPLCCSYLFRKGGRHFKNKNMMETPD